MSEREKLEKQIEAREKKYGYKRGSNASLTKPKAYANIAEGDFADPVGYNYPVDKPHIHGALGYWSQMKNRKAYSDPKARAYITEKIVKSALSKGIAVQWQSDDLDYQKLPESVKKRMEGYAPKKSMLEDYQSFRAYQEEFYQVYGKKVMVI